MISFNNIPITLRTPGQYIEIDNSRALAGLVGIDQKLLIIGQRLATGTVEAEILTRVVSDQDAEEKFGLGSMLSEMIKAARVINPYTELWAVALDDDAAADAATGTIALSGTITGSGTLSVMIGGVRVRTAVAADDTPAEVAANLAVAINAVDTLMVTAAADTATVTLTARNEGLVGNEIDIRHSYYSDEKLPAGLVVAITAMADGTANPDVGGAIAVLADQQFNYIVMPYTDTANLTAMENELESRWGPLKQIEGLCFCAASGTSAELSTLGNTRNSQFVTILGTGKSPTWAPYCAAMYGALSAHYLNDDSALPLQTLKLTGMRAPAESDRFDQSERNVLLYDGISTFVVNSGGDCLVERSITTYRTNAAGSADPSYLDVNTMATLAHIRTQVRTRISSVYARYKLADDDAYVAPGQAIVRPKDIRNELIALFINMQDAGKVEDLDQFKQDIVVERNSTDRNRVDALIPPALVGQFRVLAGQIQFRL